MVLVSYLSLYVTTLLNCWIHVKKILRTAYNVLLNSKTRITAQIKLISYVRMNSASWAFVKFEIDNSHSYYSVTLYMNYVWCIASMLRNHKPTWRPKIIVWGIPTDWERQENHKIELDDKIWEASKVPVPVWSVHVQNVKWSDKIVLFLVTWVKWGVLIKKVTTSLFYRQHEQQNNVCSQSLMRGPRYILTIIT